MGKIIISTDSTADLMQSHILDNDIKVFSMSVVMGDDVRRDGIDIHTAELFDYVLAVASGKKVKAEEAGFHDMAIFKQGVTL